MSRARTARTEHHTGLFGPVAQPIRVYRCECGDEAHYGLSYPLVQSDQWFCRLHIPAGFLPQQRSAAA